MVKIGKNWLIDLIQGGDGSIIFGLCAKAHKDYYKIQLVTDNPFFKKIKGLNLN